MDDDGDVVTLEEMKFWSWVKFSPAADLQVETGDKQ